MILTEESLVKICVTNSAGHAISTHVIASLVESVRAARAQRDELERALRLALVEVEVPGNTAQSLLEKAQEILAENAATKGCAEKPL